MALSEFWYSTFKELWDNISACVQCNTRNLQPLLHETDIVQFAKISLDHSRSVPLTLSGNIYIVRFVDWLYGLIESFAVSVE